MAQTLNWNALQDSKHIITAGIGWDYSISYSLGYAYQLKTKVPIVLTTNFQFLQAKNCWMISKPKSEERF